MFHTGRGWSMLRMASQKIIILSQELTFHKKLSWKILLLARYFLLICFCFKTHIQKAKESKPVFNTQNLSKFFHFLWFHWSKNLLEMLTKLKYLHKVFSQHPPAPIIWWILWLPLLLRSFLSKGKGKRKKRKEYQYSFQIYSSYIL